MCGVETTLQHVGSAKWGKTVQVDADDEISIVGTERT